MPYRIYPSEDSSYIVLERTGDVTRENTMDIILESHDMGRSLGIRKYLVDVVNARNTETVIGNYEFANKDIQSAPDFDRNAIVAFLVSPDDHTHDFIETLTINTGHRVRLFRNREDALAYLKTPSSY